MQRVVNDVQDQSPNGSSSSSLVVADERLRPEGRDESSPTISIDDYEKGRFYDGVYAPSGFDMMSILVSSFPTSEIVRRLREPHHMRLSLED